MSLIQVNSIENLAGEGRFGPVQLAPVSLSGAAVTLASSIPDWVTKICVSIYDGGTDGSDQWVIRLGDSGGIEATGYTGTAAALGATTAVTSHTTGFGIRSTGTVTVISGNMHLVLHDSATNKWTQANGFDSQSTAFLYTGAGRKALDSVLTQLEITTTGGTDLFDAGTASVTYE